MSRGKAWSKEELEEFNTLLDIKKIVTIKECGVVADLINEKFHNNERIRTAESIRSRTMILRKSLMPTETPQKVSFSSLLSMAHEMKKIANNICEMAHRLQDECEENKKMLRQLKQIRQAVEDFQSHQS